MNPSFNETQGINLPPVVAEQSPSHQSAEQTAQPEVAVSAPEQAPQIARAALPLATPPIPMPDPAAATAASARGDDSNTTPVGALSGVDDSDLIEKEWVNKAKAIVERTKDDPYQQTEELTVVRADYMQQHYGKTIKTDK